MTSLVLTYRFDNSKLAVAKIVKGGKRLRSKMFAELFWVGEAL